MRRHAWVDILSIVTFNYWFRERDPNRHIFSIDVHKRCIYNYKIAINTPESIASDFYYGIPAEISLFTMKGVTKLIANAPGIAHCFVYVSV